MNIKRAKDDIKDTVRMYLKKNEFGEYRIPTVRQRPIFLLGAPGIGKTAVMEQIAQELGIALVSYSMTHHTRQSALGLPFISHREFEGMSYDISEYTMSEIIASVYEVMERSGLKEGILFLDEINCVSETLAPSMLQFLQYKVFGRHRMPEGWVIVTAGNPREYNRNVREFDVVTMDRLKVMRVEADYEAWKLYAGEKGIHNAVINYLELKKQDFYRMEMTEKGRAYVTARGWEDLSQMLKLYEEDGLLVDEELVGQYLCHERVVREFTAYYDLYCKYKKDYPVREILDGKVSDEMVKRAGAAPFDERISLLGMLTDCVDNQMREVMEQADYLVSLLQALKIIRQQAETDDGKSLDTQNTDDQGAAARALEEQIHERETLLKNLGEAGALSDTERQIQKRVLWFLRERQKALPLMQRDDGEASACLKEAFEAEKAQLTKDSEETKACLHQLFSFVEQAFADGNEMLLLLTHLTVTGVDAAFIARFGCDDYQDHSKDMMLSERQDEILKEIRHIAF